MRKPGARVLLILWVGVILFIVVPWGRFQDHAHWTRIAWVPFFSPPFRATDALLNVLLYLPFGFWFVRQRGRNGLGAACLWALALSIGTEFTQVFSHGRFPTATDAACNTAGALWGALWARR